MLFTKTGLFEAGIARTPDSLRCWFFGYDSDEINTSAVAAFFEGLFRRYCEGNRPFFLFLYYTDAADTAEVEEVWQSVLAKVGAAT